MHTNATFTVYVRDTPKEPSYERGSRRSGYDPTYNLMGDYTRRLDKQTEKLEDLDDTCLDYLDRCNRTYNSARKFD
jgi:hypothetical protein